MFEAERYKCQDCGHAFDLCWVEPPDELVVICAHCDTGVPAAGNDHEGSECPQCGEVSDYDRHLGETALFLCENTECEVWTHV